VGVVHHLSADRPEEICVISDPRQAASVLACKLGMDARTARRVGQDRLSNDLDARSIDALALSKAIAKLQERVAHLEGRVWWRSIFNRRVK